MSNGGAPASLYFHEQVREAQTRGVTADADSIIAAVRRKASRHALPKLISAATGGVLGDGPTRRIGAKRTCGNPSFLCCDAACLGSRFRTHSVSKARSECIFVGNDRSRRVTAEI